MKIRILIYFASLIFTIESTSAQWSTNSTINNAICVTSNSQAFPSVVSDQIGGYFIVWQDNRFGTTYNIYAQHINEFGTALWTPNGIMICSAIGNQYMPTIISDSSGGAIIAWQDWRNGDPDIYAQRINALGIEQWALNGIAICTAVNEQSMGSSNDLLKQAIISDGEGGAIISWMDSRSGATDIYAQRINSAGVNQWTVDGEVICNATGVQISPQMATDGLGGAILIWEDNRSGSRDIYSQRINNNGNVQWNYNGVVICNEINNQFVPKLVTDGSGGVIIIWYDGRSGPNYDIYAQRLSSNGVVLWVTNGVPICTATDIQFTPTLVTDGIGGAIITWVDWRSGDEDIYAQRVNDLGITQWLADGILICDEPENEYFPIIISDLSGGAIISWYRYFNGASQDIYAQRINSSGVKLWPINGVAVSMAVGVQYRSVVVSDGLGGAVLVWDDDRSGSYNDIYAQNICIGGIVGGVYPENSIVNGNTNVCLGKEYTYNVTAIPGASYNWTLPNGWIGTSTTNTINVIPSLTSGNITVEVSNDCGIAVDSSFQITVNLLPDVTTTLAGTTISSNQNAGFYQWIDCNTNLSLLGEINQSFTATENGLYSVVVMTNNCTDTSDCISIVNVDVDEMEYLKKVSIYPNPFSTNFMITFPQTNGNYQVEIYTLTGTKVYSAQDLFGENHNFLVPGLSEGIYLIRVTNNQSGAFFIEKIIAE